MQLEKSRVRLYDMFVCNYLLLLKNRVGEAGAMSALRVHVNHVIPYILL